MMNGKVIQGYFINGRPKLPPPSQPNFPPPPIQAKTVVRPPAPAYVRPQPVVQPHGAGDAFQVDLARLGLTSGGGQPLPDAVRSQMEAALGADFSGVRVHVGPQAERIGAIAFTLGSDVYFAPGRYQPDTMQGQQVLGHELAHVMQQRAGRVRNPLGAGMAVVQDRALEAEADRLGHRAAAHRTAMQPKMPATAQPSAPVRISAPISTAPGSYRLTAGLSGRQVGSVMVHARDRGVVEVTDLGVDPAHREHGIGKMLLASAARTAQQLGRSKVTLAAQDNGSGHLIRWYRQMGFSHVGRNSRGYPELEAPINRVVSVPQRPSAVLAQLKPARDLKVNAYDRILSEAHWVPAHQSKVFTHVIQEMQGGSQTDPGDQGVRAAGHSTSATSKSRRSKRAGAGYELVGKLSFWRGRKHDERGKFFSLLSNVQNVRGGNQWHAFDCAEAQVVGSLVLDGYSLSTIVITSITRNGEPAKPCRNCKQWLVKAGNNWVVREQVVHPPSQHVPVPAPLGPPAEPAQRPRITLRELAAEMNIYEFLNTDNTSAFERAEEIADELGKQL
jgi:ribosomal protein S18 acetylase RimI-like enzyme